MRVSGVRCGREWPNPEFRPCPPWMAQGHILPLCFALIPFCDYPLSIFLVFSITSLAFLWYRSSKSSWTRSNHSTSHSDKGRSDAINDMFSVLERPTVTATTQTTWTCQPYDAFLVLDVEATCLKGTDFHWPNEIIVSYRIGTRSHCSVENRNGQFVSLSGRTGSPMEWSVPCRKSQNSAVLLNQHGVPSCPLFASPSPE